jgi:outer membrane lipoprotein LolB
VTTRLGLSLLVLCVALAGCQTRPVAPVAPLAPRPWEERVAMLQQAREWELDGRTAVSLGDQGWQASLDWRQNEDTSELHLAGPLGTGATQVTLTPAGVSVNGAAPSAAQTEKLDEKLGFALPLAQLRYWLLGVPAPGERFEVTQNADGRAASLTQAGWSIEYERYLQVSDDWLPKLLSMTRAQVRVRVAVDHWTLAR